MSSLAANQGTPAWPTSATSDRKVLDRFSAESQKLLGYALAASGDFRKALESRNVDVLTIACPDHPQLRETLEVQV